MNDIWVLTRRALAKFVMIYIYFRSPFDFGVQKEKDARMEVEREEAHDSLASGFSRSLTAEDIKRM